MDIMSAIALLCQVNLGAMGIKIKEIEEVQLTCQKYYASCIRANIQEELRRCIIEKK